MIVGKVGGNIDMSAEFNADPLMHEQADGLQQVEITLYSYGGCTTCGNSMWNWFRQQNLKVDHHNVQVEYERRAAYELAVEHGYKQREVRFPMFYVNGKVIVDFQPELLLAEINKLREG